MSEPQTSIAHSGLTGDQSRAHERPMSVPAQAGIDLELFPARGHYSVAFNLDIAGQLESHLSAGRIDVELFRARGQALMAIRPYMVGRISHTASCRSDFLSP